MGEVDCISHFGKPLSLLLLTVGYQLPNLAIIVVFLFVLLDSNEKLQVILQLADKVLLASLVFFFLLLWPVF